MPEIDALIRYVKSEFARNVKSQITLPAREGNFAELPKHLHPELKQALLQDNIEKLYSHQSLAFHSVLARKDTLLVSRTASGKTLSFLLPVLQDYLQQDTGFTVLLLYPTKALARDQEGTLGKLLQHVVQEQKLGTYDGDTPTAERDKIRSSADFMITNPDMLHSGILPNHNRKWKSFFSRLRYIIVDEVHTYRGAFGSHVSNVFSRLLRICEIHASAPQFICSSATIGNPKKHIETLFKREFYTVSEDGSPAPEKNLLLLNPSLFTNNAGSQYRKGTSSLSIPLLRYATRNGFRSICFCRGRQEVERLYRSILDGQPSLEGKVKPYRGGLLPDERRRLERDFFQGKIQTIISTNALELGINIGDLDICVLSGHPGTVASFWQQAGRVGRGGKGSAIIYLAKDMPIDQYIVNHPDYITQTQVEEAWLNPYNPYILLQHLPCAAYEKPLQALEEKFSGEAYPFALEVLLENKTLKPYRSNYRYALHEYPSKGVNLRGMTDFNIQIYCNGKVIGELDPIGARGTLYKDAIYQHLGKKYMSLELDLEKKFCEVTPVQVDYFTEASWEGMVQLTEKDESEEHNGAKLDFGEIHIDKQPKLYKKIKEKSFENVGYGPITLAPFSYDTTGFSMLAPQIWLTEMGKLDKRYVDAALHGLAYILKRTAPSLCMGDMQDIDTDISLIDAASNRWHSALYLYDSHEGGVGYAEKIFEKFREALELCQTIILECECHSGCPSCVTPQPPGIQNLELEELLVTSNASVSCTLNLIEFILTGTFQKPEIIFEKILAQAANKEWDEKQEEEKKLRNRLGRAASILEKKRERLH
ncbi:MAG: DEAD/DEAH box helicase [Spirochaetota bacterium]